MPKRPIDPESVVVFTGAGVSAPSGIPTFRSGTGLWCQHRIEDVATPDAWRRQPELVLDFYNERRAYAASVEPNSAHHAIAKLEQRFKVTVITQNVDDLHERAGSHNVIHLHGELRKARSTLDASLVYDLGSSAIRLGDCCALGAQLRPHIVWFGEEIMHYAESREHISTASKLLVVGTSLAVYPAAGLLKHARNSAEKVIVDLEVAKRPYGFRFVAGSADKMVPQIVANWINENAPQSV
jgi:NAD-dependent deacetylase